MVQTGIGEVCAIGALGRIALEAGVRMDLVGIG